MRRVLDMVEPNPMDLFQCLDVDGLAFGFSCVGLAFERSVLESMVTVIQRNADTTHGGVTSRDLCRGHTESFLESLSWFEMFQSIACWT